MKPNQWIEKILEVVRKTNHIYMCLTKNPERYLEFDLPRNIWTGTTLDFGRKESKAPANETRIEAISILDHDNKFLSIEPFYKNQGEKYQYYIHGTCIFCKMNFKTCTESKCRVYKLKKIIDDFFDRVENKEKVMYNDN